MKPLRLSVFLPRPTGFYRGLLPQMLRGFEQAGFEVSGTTEHLGEAELLDWCRSHKTDVVFEMNRTRSEVPFLPRSILHISWVVDFLGRTEAQIQGSDLTYFFTTGWVTAHPSLADARAIEQTLLDRLISNGGTVRRFVGHTVVETPGA